MRPRPPATYRQNPGLRRALALASTLVLLSVWLVKDGAAPPSHAVADLEVAPPPPHQSSVTKRIAKNWTVVRTSPSQDAKVLGLIGPDEPFEVFGPAGGAGCTEGGWAKTEGGGFVCLNESRLTEEASVRLPRLVRFVHPDPSEWDTYLKTMTYDMNPAGKIDALAPFIYAKRWRRWSGPNYSSADSFSRGDPPVHRLGTGRKYHFIDSEPTERGTVLVREGGAVVPANQVHVYPLSKFHGWNLRSQPLPDGHLPAWAIDYDGTPIHTAPSHNSPVAATLDYHTAIVVEDEAVDRAGHWWMMPNGLGPGVPGFVNDQTGIRHWAPSKEPAGVGPADLWLDVDLDQQVLAMRRGSDLEFVTLVSTGAPGTSTPRGIYDLKDKTVWGDMSSRPSSDDPYYVEKVPWVMHFKKRYALHGTFWHWGFGHTASHGCINLSVRDARWIFDRVSPVAYGGWHKAVASSEAPGTVLRIRRGQASVPDRRTAG